MGQANVLGDEQGRTPQALERQGTADLLQTELEEIQKKSKEESLTDEETHAREVAALVASKDNTIQWLQEQIETLHENVAGTIRRANADEETSSDLDASKRKLEEIIQITNARDREINALMETRDIEIMQLKEKIGSLEQQALSETVKLEGNDAHPDPDLKSLLEKRDLEIV